MGDSGTTMAMVQRMQRYHTDHRSPWIAALDFWISGFMQGEIGFHDSAGGVAVVSLHFHFFCSKGEEQQDGCCLSDTYPTYVFF